MKSLLKAPFSDLTVGDEFHKLVVEMTSEQCSKPGVGCFI